MDTSRSNLSLILLYYNKFSEKTGFFQKERGELLHVFHVLQQFSDFRIGHTGNACNSVFRIANDFDIDGSRRVPIQRIKGFIGPNIQKDAYQLSLVVILFSVKRNACCPVLRCLRFLPFLLPIYFQVIK